MSDAVDIIATSHKPRRIFLSFGVLIGIINALMSIDALRSAHWFLFINYTLILFSMYFVFACDGKRKVRLLWWSLILAMIFSYCFVWGDEIFNWGLLVIAAYASNSLLQVYHQQNALSAPYPMFFDSVWTNFTRMLFAFILVLMFLLVLEVSGILFSTVGASVVFNMFNSSVFFGLSVPIMFFIGLYLSYHLENTLFYLRFALLKLCQVLQPILTVFGIIYLISWIVAMFIPVIMKVHHQQVSILLPGFTLLAIIFINALYQDGKDKHGILHWQKKSVALLIILLLIFSLQAVWMLFKYNINFKLPITSIQLITMIANFLLLIYTIAYCLVLCGSKKPWLSRLAGVNVSLAWLSIIVIVIMALPLWYKVGLVKKSMTSAATPAQIKVKHYTLSDAGLAWQAFPSKNPVLLGYANNQALHLCRAKIAGTFVPGELAGNRCAINFNQKVYYPKRFDVLAGSGKVSWSGWSSNKKQFQVYLSRQVKREKKTLTEKMNICRLIYNNRIHLGYIVDYMQCLGVDQGKAVNMGVNGVSYLYAQAI